MKCIQYWDLSMSTNVYLKALVDILDGRHEAHAIVAAGPHSRRAPWMLNKRTAALHLVGLTAPNLWAKFGLRGEIGLSATKGCRGTQS